MDKEILTPLNAIEASLDTLVRSLTTSQTYSAGPKAARDIVVADNDLQDALTRLRRHQDNVLQLQRLRAEADSLNAKIKNTVLTAVSLRKELGEINYSILEDSDDDSEAEEEQPSPVDYETLLAFATRIGKHNAVAAQEAEKLVEQQYLTAKRSQTQNKSQQSTTGPNGIHTTTIGDDDTTTEQQSQPTSSSQAQQTAQINEQISEFQNRRNWDRAQVTAPFPNAEILRIGELGKLQIQREQNGEDYSDGYVEVLVKQSELKQDEVVVPQREDPDLEEAKVAAASSQNRQAGERRPAQQGQERRPEVKPKKTLNLDFPDDDDDDEDEGDDD